MYYCTYRLHLSRGQICPVYYIYIYMYYILVQSDRNISAKYETIHTSIYSNWVQVNTLKFGILYVMQCIVCYVKN